MNRFPAVDEYERMERSYPFGLAPPRAPAGRRVAHDGCGVGGVYRQIRFLTRNDTYAAMDNAQRVVDFAATVPLSSQRTVQDVVMHSHTPRPGPELVLRDGALSLDRCLPAVGVLPSPRHLPPDQEHLRQRHRRRPGDPRRVPTCRSHAPRRRVRRHAPAFRPADLQHRHVRVDRRPVRRDAVAALRMGVHRRRCLREHPPHPPELWAMLHPAITLLAIVATANHYWLDAAVAGVLVVAAAALLGARRERQAAVTALPACGHLPACGRRRANSWAGSPAASDPPVWTFRPPLDRRAGSGRGRAS